MRRLYVFFVALLVIMQAFSQVELTVYNENAGILALNFSDDHYATVTTLTITGKLNAYDFVFLRRFQALDSLNLSGVDIEEFEGEVYHVANYNHYPANEFPHAGLRGSGVKKVVFPVSINSIGHEAFSRSSLQGTLTIPASIRTVGNSAFGECSGITSLRFNEGLESLGASAFADCSNLTDSLRFPQSLKSIGDGAFSICLKLPGFAPLPPSLEHIGTYVFRECVAITGSVHIPSTVLSVGHGVFMSSGVSGAIVELDSVGAAMFDNCQNLESLTLLNTKVVRDGAFAQCKKLKKIILPATVTEIGFEGFAMCQLVDTIFSYNPVPPVLGTAALMGINRSACKIMVPATAIDAYKAAPQWSEFGESILNNDTSAPQLLFQYPGNTTETSLTPSLQFIWDEKVVLTDQFSVQFVKKSNREMVYAFGSGNKVSTDSTMTYMEPMRYSSLLPGTEYEVMVAAGSVSDLHGNLFPTTDQYYPFTTGAANPQLVLDFNSAQYTHQNTEYLGFTKSAIPCMNDLIAQKTYYTHRFFSRDLLEESNIPFRVYKSVDECLYETPQTYTPVPYVSLDNTSLVLNKANEYSLYPDAHSKVVADLTTFPAGAVITDVVVRVSATSFEGLDNTLQLKAWFTNSIVREFELSGTEDAGYFDYEADSYGTKYYYRELHFPVLNGENIDSVALFRNGFNVVKLMKMQVNYKVTSAPVVNLGPDRAICVMDEEYLDAGFFPNASYVWSTGSKTQTIRVQATNTYWVEVKNSFGTSRDTVHIRSYPMPLKAFRDSTIVKCAGESVTLSALSNPTFTYRWNTGATTRSITVMEEGLYTCLVSNGVCSTIDSVGVVNRSSNLGFTITPCCSAGYDDIQGELYRKNESNRFELYESKIMYGDMAFFTNMPSGEYIFKAHFLKYSNGSENPWLDTYHNGSTVWSAATVLSVDCMTDTMIMIALATRPTGFAFNGNGAISGNISIRQAPSPDGMKRALRNAVECEAKVMLYTADDQLIAATCPNDQGNYSFINLPEGNYKLVVERTGYGLQDEIQLQLSADQPEVVVNLIVDEASGTIIPNVKTGTGSLSEVDGIRVRIYPNPARDVVMLYITSLHSGKIKAQLSDITGKMVWSTELNPREGEQVLPIVNEGWKGMYLLQLSSNYLTSTTVLIFE
ncbi:MAG: leucine-rich repeat protein [Paludibacter sp.]|jgi:hypothetical protein|nr:leucine-rich repeat protein [Paludibacter sp.]